MQRLAHFSNGGCETPCTDDGTMGEIDGLKALSAGRKVGFAYFSRTVFETVESSNGRKTTPQTVQLGGTQYGTTS
ncbi:MAG: hypothetical protein Aurels2KO_49660 [Aureliella sp.]